jgi:hypothetical protein
MLPPRGSDFIQGELNLAIELFGICRQNAIPAPRRGYPCVIFDRGRHDKAVVIVGMLADEIDPAWSAENQRRCSVETNKTFRQGGGGCARAKLRRETHSHNVQLLPVDDTL